MGTPCIPALLVLDPEALVSRDMRPEDISWDDIEELGLGTRYVKREGEWYLEGAQGLGQAQVHELEAAYEFCSRNGDEGIELSLYHLGFRDYPVRVRIIDVDGEYTERDREAQAGLPDDIYVEPEFTEDIRNRTFTDRGFHGVTGYRFKSCCFEGPALRSTSGVVAMDCVFGDLAMHKSRKGFLEGDIWDLGNMRDSVAVVQFFGNIQYPRFRNRGSLIVLYGSHGIYGREGNVISVPYGKLFTDKRKRKSEAELARKLFRLEWTKREDFPQWFLDRYWGKRLWSTGLGKKAGEAPGPVNGGNISEEEAAMAVLMNQLETDALPETEPRRWEGYKDLRDDVLRCLGEHNKALLDIWLDGGGKGAPPSLSSLNPALNRKLERMGYPVRGKEKEYLDHIDRTSRAIRKRATSNSREIPMEKMMDIRKRQEEAEREGKA